LSATAAALEDLQHSGNISPRMPAHPNQFRVYSALVTFYSPLLNLFQEPLRIQMLFCVVKGIELFRSVTSLANDCPNVRDLEDPLAVFRNYPWTRHGLKDSSLGYKFPTANYCGEEIVGFDIRATHCTGTSENGDTCFQCKKTQEKGQSSLITI
jgi:hypothetical protein